MADPTGAGQTAPFSKFEWMIAWRYLRSKRAEGGVSVMTWVSLDRHHVWRSLRCWRPWPCGQAFGPSLSAPLSAPNAHITVYYSTAVD